MKRFLLLIVGILVSVGCLALAMRETAWKDVVGGLVNADYRTLPIILGLLFLFYWLKAIRWKWLLAPVAPLTTAQLFSPVMIGFAVNNILPAHLGEFVRVFVVRRKYGIPVGTVLSTVVLERILDVLAILGLFSIGLLFAKDMPPEYRNIASLAAAGSVGVVVCVAAYLIWTAAFLRFVTWCFSIIPWIPGSLSGGIIDLLSKGADGLAALKSGRAVLLITLNSLAQWLLNGLIAFTALRSFGLEVSPATGMIVTGVTAFGVIIPSTPGYFGVIQLCFQKSMEAQQLTPDPSLVLGASIYYQLSMYFPVTALGMYYLNQLGLSLGELRHAAESRNETKTEPTPTANAQAEHTASPM